MKTFIISGSYSYTGQLIANLVVRSGLEPILAGRDEQRQNGFSLIVGEAFDDDGESVASKLKMPEGYGMTALATVEIMQRILSGELKPGFQTPSLAYGPDFIQGFEGVERVDL